MKHDFTELERRRLLELAREYRKRGYDVITEPTKEQLPDFLATLQPDMIARNEQENVVFEVKSQQTLSASPELKDIAQAVQGKKGWRFELVVTNPRDKADIKPNGNILLSRAEAFDRLQEARDLSEQEHGEAAFLVAWSATEAVLRKLVTTFGISSVRDNSELIVKNLFVQGFLNKEQYETLLEGVNVRNSILHGYQVSHPYANNFNKLLHTTEQIMNEELKEIRF